MAIYHLHTEPASRGSGKNAVAMAAYRSGGRLIDERTGEIKEGKTSTIQQLKEIRSEWVELSNKALERQGREERIRAKSYEARGIDQEPTIHIGPDAMAMERKGIRTRKVTLNNAIRKRNLRRILVRRMGRVRREMEEAQGKILDLEKEIAQIAIEQQREDRSAPQRTASDLLKGYSPPEGMEKEEERKSSVTELLNRKPIDRKKGINRDDRIER